MLVLVIYKENPLFSYQKKRIEIKKGEYLFLKKCKDETFGCSFIILCFTMSRKMRKNDLEK